MEGYTLVVGLDIHTVFLMVDVSNICRRSRTRLQNVAKTCKDKNSLNTVFLNIKYCSVMVIITIKL